MVYELTSTDGRKSFYGKAKVLVGVCKGKKLYDKRMTIKKRDLERESRKNI